MNDAAGRTSQGNAGLPLGAALSRFFALADRYYDSYNAYVSRSGGEGACVGRAGETVSGVASAKVGVVPPVWVGCRYDGDAGVSGDISFVARVLGDVPVSGKPGVAVGEKNGGTDADGGGCPVVEPVPGVAGACAADSEGSSARPVRVPRDAAGAVAEVSVGRNHARNLRKRASAKAKRARGGCGNGGEPVGGVAGATEEAKVAGDGSTTGSVRTVDTRTGIEIEAAQTLAARRVAENNLKILEARAAAKLVEHRLRALNDKERTLVIDRLAAARLEEKINTSKKRSQASFKECGSPIDSVGSALSAHEFAFKQQVRKIEAQKVENRYKDEQLKKFYQYASPDVRRMVAEMPEPHIPTDEEMEAEDADQSSEPTDEEMEAEAARYFS